MPEPRWLTRGKCALSGPRPRRPRGSRHPAPLAARWDRLCISSLRESRGRPRPSRHCMMPRHHWPPALRRCGRRSDTSCSEIGFADWITSMSEGTARRPVVETPMIRQARRQAPTVIVGILFVAMIGLSIWYLSRREPLVIQGEVQSRTFDLAARVDGRIGEIVASRSQDVRRDAPLIRIDNPELIAKERQSEAALR